MGGRMVNRLLHVVVASSLLIAVGIAAGAPASAQQDSKEQADWDRLLPRCQNGDRNACAKLGQTRAARTGNSGDPPSAAPPAQQGVPASPLSQNAPAAPT